MSIALPRRLADLALPICLAAMDACWVYVAAWMCSTVLLSIHSDLYVPLLPPVLAALQLAGWWFGSLLLDHTRWPLTIVRIIAGVVGILACAAAVFATVPIALPPANGIYTSAWAGIAGYPFAWGMIMWFMGSTRAAQRPGFSDAYNDFRLGIIVMGLATILAGLIAGGKINTIWAGLGSLPLWFFVWALAALAIGNRDVVRQETGQREGWTWTAVLAGSILLVVVAGALGAALGVQNLIDPVQKLVGFLVLLVGGGLYLLIFAISWLWATLFGDLPRSPWGTPPPTPTPNPDNPPNNGPPPLGPSRVPLDLSFIPENVLRWIAVFLILAAVVWVVTWGLRRTQRDRARDFDEDRESLGGWRLLWQQFTDWLARLTSFLFPKQATQATGQVDDLTALAGKPEWSGTLSVRQIYARLQRLAGRVGYPRHPEQTPLEYLAVLAAALPGLQSDFEEITAAYLEARYGPLPASAPAVLAATNAWKRAEPVLAARVGAEGSSG